LRVLYRLALAEGDDHKIEATLWALVRDVPNETWALQSLLTRAYRKHDTAAVRDALALWMQLVPNNRRARSDWAMATLLLEAQRPNALVRQYTREAHAVEPRNPHFAAAHALCLWRDAQPQQALAVLAALEPAQLRVPGRALLYGALLAEANRGAEARPFLDIAARMPLLAEESVILREAQSKAGIKP
jgi:hypothetical protein